MPELKHLCKEEWAKCQYVLLEDARYRRRGRWRLTKGEPVIEPIENQHETKQKSKQNPSLNQ